MNLPKTEKITIDENNIQHINLAKNNKIRSTKLEDRIDITNENNILLKQLNKQIFELKTELRKNYINKKLNEKRGIIINNEIKETQKQVTPEKIKNQFYQKGSLYYSGSKYEIKEDHIQDINIEEIIKKYKTLKIRDNTEEKSDINDDNQTTKSIYFTSNFKKLFDLEETNSKFSQNEHNDMIHNSIKETISQKENESDNEQGQNIIDNKIGENGNDNKNNIKTKIFKFLLLKNKSISDIHILFEKMVKLKHYKYFYAKKSENLDINIILLGFSEFKYLSIKNFENFNFMNLDYSEVDSNQLINEMKGSWIIRDNIVNNIHEIYEVNEENEDSTLLQTLLEDNKNAKRDAQNKNGNKIDKRRPKSKTIYVETKRSKKNK